MCQDTVAALADYVVERVGSDLSAEQRIVVSLCRHECDRGDARLLSLFQQELPEDSRQRVSGRSRSIDNAVLALASAAQLALHHPLPEFEIEYWGKLACWQLFRASQKEDS